MLAGQSRNASNGAVVADQGCFIRFFKTRHGVDDRVGDLEPAGRLGQLLDQPDELVAAVAVVAGESDELSASRRLREPGGSSCLTLRESVPGILRSPGTLLQSV